MSIYIIMTKNRLVDELVGFQVLPFYLLSSQSNRKKLSVGWVFGTSYSSLIKVRSAGFCCYTIHTKISTLIHHFLCLALGHLHVASRHRSDHPPPFPRPIVPIASTVTKMGDAAQ